MQAFGCGVDTEHPIEQRADEQDGKQLTDSLELEHLPHGAGKAFYLIFHGNPLFPFFFPVPIIPPAPGGGKGGALFEKKGLLFGGGRAIITLAVQKAADMRMWRNWQTR